MVFGGIAQKNLIDFDECVVVCVRKLAFKFADFEGPVGEVRMFLKIDCLNVTLAVE